MSHGVWAKKKTELLVYGYCHRVQSLLKELYDDDKCATAASIGNYQYVMPDYQGLSSGVGLFRVKA